MRKIAPYRSMEGILLGLISLILLLGFLLVTGALEVQEGRNPLPALPGALPAPLLLTAGWASLHILLWLKRIRVEQILLPLTALLVNLGMILLWRLRGAEGVWQQITRGFLPGIILLGAFVAYPRLIETMRRLAIPASLVGLALPIATAMFGAVDETGARLALKLGPLPAIQTSEFLKIALIIFLAWFVDREGEVTEGRAQTVLGMLRLPPLEYFLPGGLFVMMATLALVQMSDFGAVLILGGVFIAMIYAGFETRIFATLAAIGVVFAILAGVLLAFAWDVPTVIEYRFLAFRDPWSTTMLTYNGQPTGVTIAEGPGYQIQQAVYAIIAGGISGQGLGFGTPGYVPLVHSDFIFAALLEELGSAVGLAVIFVYILLLLRIFRVAVLLPPGQVFERMLLIGIGAHLFVQVFVMIGGTLNLIPLTGVTVPFLSQGGIALMVNLAEIGMAMALLPRLETTA